MREVCKASFQLAAEQGGDGSTFKGLASVFNTLVDAYIPTIIEPGAFTKTLAENASRVRVLYQHDDRCPIGKPTRMVETSVGLEVEARISDTADGRDCKTLIADGVVTDLSIGFDPMKEEFVKPADAASHPWAREHRWPGYDQGASLRIVKEVRLWEFSPVTWGANPPAKIQEIYAALRGQPPHSPKDLNETVREIVARVTADDGEAAGLLVGPLSAFIEQHVGKVLSGRNLQLAKDARGACEQVSAALATLIAAAEPPDSSDEDESALTATDRQRFMAAQLRIAELKQRLAA